jgi:hypothetical protein
LRTQQIYKKKVKIYIESSLEINKILNDIIEKNIKFFKKLKDKFN